MPRGWNNLKINTKTLIVILSKIYSSSSLNCVIKNNNTKILSLMSLIPHYQVKETRKKNWLTNVKIVLIWFLVQVILVFPRGFLSILIFSCTKSCVDKLDLSSIHLILFIILYKKNCYLCFPNSKIRLLPMCIRWISLEKFSGNALLLVLALL